jgi:hypothetical protein
LDRLGWNDSDEVYGTDVTSLAGDYSILIEVVKISVVRCSNSVIPITSVLVSAVGTRESHVSEGIALDFDSFFNSTMRLVDHESGNTK